jgi:hypothetical protein
MTANQMQTGSNLNLIASGNSPIPEPVTAHAFPLMPSAFSQCDASSLIFLATLLPVNVPAGYDYAVYTTLPQLTFRFTDDPTDFILSYRIQTGQPTSANRWTDLINSLNGLTPQPGQWLIIRRQFVQLDTGQLGSDSFVGIPIT